MTAAGRALKWIGAGVAVAALALFTLPSLAFGQTVVPPGNSEADQYFEATPDATGDKSLDGSREPADVLTPNQLAELEALGPDGAAAAALAASTAPSAASSSAGSDAEANGATAPSGQAATLSADSQGMGTWLWVIIVVSAVAGLAIGAVRWRARGGAGAASP